MNKFQNIENEHKLMILLPGDLEVELFADHVPVVRLSNEKELIGVLVRKEYPLSSILSPHDPSLSLCKQSKVCGNVEDFLTPLIARLSLPNNSIINMFNWRVGKRVLR